MEQFLREEIAHFFKEDGLSDYPLYLKSLPNDLVRASLKFKSDCLVAGTSYFETVFTFLGADSKVFHQLKEIEGKPVKAGTDLEFLLPFSVALTGERLALNLLAHASKIATHTQNFVLAADGVKILDTRKTTPGLRNLEKYAVVVGGGHNHRMSQTDVWMIKDNHKKFFGGVSQSIEFFKKQKSFYKPIVLEIHSLPELSLGISCGINHFMLDNFTPSMIKSAVELKRDGMTYEVSGGITLQNVKEFLHQGVDAISTSSLVHGAPPVDLSFKMERA